MDGGTVRGVGQGSGWRNSKGSGTREWMVEQ